jgi:hypothetical protein
VRQGRATNEKKANKVIKQQPNGCSSIIAQETSEDVAVSLLKAANSFFIRLEQVKQLHMRNRQHKMEIRAKS